MPTSMARSQLCAMFSALAVLASLMRPLRLAARKEQRCESYEMVRLVRDGAGALPTNAAENDFA